MRCVADTDGLGLESVGVETRPNGTIVVDEFSNAADNVFALGDVIGSGWDLTPAAIAAGATRVLGCAGEAPCVGC